MLVLVPKCYKMKENNKKLKKVQLTQQEIWDSLRVPPPYKSKKDYKRKPKHKKGDSDNWYPDTQL